MADIVFDPTQPFDVVGSNTQATTPTFDPTQPFEIAETFTPPAFGGADTIPKPDTAGMYNEPKFTSEPNPQLTNDAKGEPIIPKMAEVAQGVGMGLASLPMGLGELLIDKPFSTDYFTSGNTARAEKVKELGVEGPAGAASMLASFAPGTLVLKARPLVQAGVEALSFGATALGEGKSDVAAATDAAIAGFGVYIPSKIVEVLSDKTGRASKYLIEKMGLSEDEARLLIEGLPADKDKQALALANIGGDRTVGSIKRVGAHSDDTALKLYEDLQARVKVMLETIGPVDVTLQRSRYKDLATKIELKNPVTHDASGIADNLNFLERFYGATPSKANTLVAQMKGVLADGQGLKVSDAMEFTRDLNYLISKASRGKERVKLNEIKQNIDGFLSRTLSKEDKNAFTMMNREYADTMNNAQLLDIVNKATIGERGINWVKLHENITKEGLSSHEVNNALAIAKEFTSRFGSDHKLVAASGEKSINLDTGGFLGTTSYLINKTLNMGALWGERHNAVVVQNAIARALKKGGTELDFVNNLKSNKFIPTTFVEDMELLLRTPIREARNVGIVKTVNHENPTINLSHVGDDIYNVGVNGTGSRVTDSQVVAFDTIHDIGGSFKLPDTKLSADERFRTSFSIISYMDKNPVNGSRIFSEADLAIARGNVQHLQNLVEKGETKIPGGLNPEELAFIRERFETPTFRETRVANEARIAEEARAAQEATRNQAIVDDVAGARESTASTRLEDRLSRQSNSGVAEQVSSGNDILNGVEGLHSQVIGNNLNIRAVLPDGTKTRPARFTLEPDGVYRANTASLPAGSGAGNKIYTAVWDMVEQTGAKAQATTGMLPVNQYRMSVNQMQYIASRGTDAPHVLLYGGERNAQKGVTRDMDGLPLTIENANRMAENFKSWFNRSVLPSGTNITARTTDEQIAQIVKSDRGSRGSQETPQYPFSEKTLKLIRDYARSGSLTARAAILAMLEKQPDFRARLKAMEE